MKVTKLIYFFIASFLFGSAIAQPNINNIEPASIYYNGEVSISGSGFGSNVNDVIIWFGGVKASTIVSVAENIIKVKVPSGAPNAPISVQKISTGLTGTSNKQFYITHSGLDFDLSQLNAPLKFDEGTTALFDVCGCDFDNDGLTDFATTETTGTEISLFLNTSTIGNISFNSSTLNSTTPTTGIGCADLDGDGKSDLYMTRAGSNRNQLYIYKNESTGAGDLSFGPKISINLETTNSTVNTYQAIRVVHGDLNGDGKLDLVVTNGNTTEKLLNIILNTSTVGSISFAAATIVNVPEMSTNSGLSIMDVDNDGILDLVLTRTLAADVFIYRGIGGGGVNYEAPLILSTTSQSVTNVSAIDLNNDGRMEIITSEVLSKNVLIYENTSSPGSLSFGAPIRFEVADEPWTVKGIDLDGNGLLDLAVSSITESKYSVLINNGNLSFTPFEQTVDLATRNIYTGDIDGDAKPDIAYTSLGAAFALQVIRNTNCFKPKIQTETPLAICPGQTITIVFPDSPGTTFSWTKDVTPVAGSTNTLDVTASGVYEVTAVSEAGGCTETSSITVADGTGSVPTVPVASNDGPACAGDDVTLLVGAQSGATYSWSGPNGFSSTDQNPIITGISESMAGLYTVTVKIGDCLSSSAETNLVVNGVQSFSISASGATTICAGGSVSLTTQNRAGFTYKWLRDGNDAGGSGTAFNASTSGTYSTMVTDNGTGCSVTTNEIVVTILSVPIASFTVTNPICKGIDATFTNTSTVDPGATVTYNWDFGDGSTIGTTDAAHAYATANTFNVTLIIVYDGITGCTASVSNNAVVVEATPVTITATDDFICPNSTIDLTANGTYDTFGWNTGDNTQTITVDTEGTYSVSATDNNGCISSLQIDVIIGTIPTIIITADGNPGPITVETGVPVQLLAEGADSYTWMPTDFLSDATIANPISTPTADITYTVSGTVTGACTGTADITLNIEQVTQGEINIKPLKVFSPNSTIDPTWRIDDVLNYPDCTLSIFDERGTLVFRKLGYDNTWDATYQGGQLPEGVYYYVFSCPSLKPKTGTVLVAR